MDNVIHVEFLDVDEVICLALGLAGINRIEFQRRKIVSLSGTKYWYECVVNGKKLKIRTNDNCVKALAKGSPAEFIEEILMFFGIPADVIFDEGEKSTECR